jgi:Kef-type K+ transport system membrane component KefB
MLANWFPELFPIRDPVLIFAIVLVLFLVSPIAMGRFRLPGMIGLLLAGAILGPHALGLLARDASFVLLGAVGLIYIMFTAALEVDLSVFRKYGLQGVVFGVLTFSLPQGIGTLVAYYILGFDWLAAILLASMFASHTLLAYPIVSRLGLSSNQAVTATLGGTMITDTAALLVLAVVAGMASGEVTDAFWWRLGVSVTVFVAGILIGLPRLGRWFFRRVAEDGPAEFVFVLTSVFLCAALSHAAGLEPIVGAFLAGLALNRLIPHESPLMNRLIFTGDAIFIPFFLLSVGMLLDAGVLFGGLRTWYVAIGMTVTVIATKWLAARAARIVFRYRKEEGEIMFGLSVPQAAATLAAVMVGHRIELFDDAVVNGTIVMILVTCVLGPSVVSKNAPALAKAAGEQAGTEPGQTRGVLVPLRSTEQADSAVELALLLRSGDKHAPLYPAFIAADDPYVERSMALADRVLARAASQVNAAGGVAQPVKRVHDHPGRALIRTRKELGVRDVVVPWDPSASGGAPRTSRPSVSHTDPPPSPDAHPRFSRVVDDLTTDAGANLFLCRLPHSLGTCKRIVLCMPSDVMSADGFAEAVPIVQRLCKALGAPLLLLCDERDQSQLRAAFAPTSPIKTDLATYASARMWLSLTMNHVEESDLLVAYGVRDDAPAFSTEYGDFAANLFSRYPQNDVILFYPAAANARDTARTPVAPLQVASDVQV